MDILSEGRSKEEVIEDVLQQMWKYVIVIFRKQWNVLKHFKICVTVVHVHYKHSSILLFAGLTRPTVSEMRNLYVFNNLIVDVTFWFLLLCMWLWCIPVFRCKLLLAWMKCLSPFIMLNSAIMNEICVKHIVFRDQMSQCQYGTSWTSLARESSTQILPQWGCAHFTLGLFRSPLHSCGP